MIPATFPRQLNTPPLRPIIFSGAVSDITAQPMADSPLPKNASVISAITAASVETKFAIASIAAKNMPSTNGVLRAFDGLIPRRIM
ncbi:hypothetical protein D3C80_1663750 [compost metagenome]